MASRFWVGGTGTWDASTTTHWSATSGGAGGASVPGSADAATFDAASGGGTVTTNYDMTVISLIMGAFTGTLDFSSSNPTITGTFSGTGSGTRTLNLGSGTFTLSGTPGVSWDFNVPTNLTLNAGTSTIRLTDTSSSTLTFTGGSKTYYKLWFDRGTSTGTNVINATNTFNDIRDTGTVAHSLQFAAGSTQTVTTFSVSGSSGSVISLISSNTAVYNLVKTGGGTISCDYLNIQHSVATPSSTWYAGTNSVNNQAVVTAGSGWIFTAPPAPPSAAISVQSGSTTLGSGTASSAVTLTTPVATGQSFVIASVRGTNTDASAAMARATLSDVSGPNYTKVTLTRTTTTGTVVIDWQVVTSTSFTVQSGETTFANSTTLDVTVSAVTASKAFLVFTNSYDATQNDPNGRANPFSGRFTSTTNIRFEKQMADPTKVPTVSWYVVEWTGATVQSGGVAIGSGSSSNTATISSVTAASTFVLHSYHQTDATNQGNANATLVDAVLTNATTLTFTRGTTTTAKQVYFFVVSHPNFSVQSGTVSVTGGNASNTATISSVVTGNTFMAYGSSVANVRSTNATTDAQFSYWTTPVLTNATTVTATSAGTSDTRTVPYYAVSYVDSVTTNGAFLMNFI